MASLTTKASSMGTLQAPPARSSDPSPQRIGSATAGRPAIRPGADGTQLLSLGVLPNDSEDWLTAEGSSRLIEAILLQRSVFAAAAHDMQDPLAVMKLALCLLKDRFEGLKTGPVETVCPELIVAQRAAEQMTRQVGELRDIALVQLGEPIPLERQRVGLAELAREVSAGYRRSGSRQIEVIVDEPEIYGFWDRTRLRRVLENLLSNAMKYSPDNGVVTIRVSSTSRDDSPWAVLTMQDQGMGIPEDDLPHIFNGLYRGKNVTAQTRGSGIGLLSVRLIVERHGGDISVESREGKGTRFRVRLPMEEREDRLPNPT